MMLPGSWRARKGRSVAMAIVAIIFVSTLSYRLYYQSSLSVVSLGLPEAGHSNDTKAFEPMGNSTLREQLASSYIKSILDPEDKNLDRLQCPSPNFERYDYLIHNEGGQIKYFFALNLRQCLSILPRLIGSIVEAVRFLGPENCALSIVEGMSDDGTLEILAELRQEMRSLGLEYHLLSSDIDTKQGDRIEGLSALRNLALEPLLGNSNHYAPDTAVIFLNDVAICMDDILELVHQRVFQQADMTCALDWSSIEPAPIFYDIWIARMINGDTFWEMPADGGWRFASELFWRHDLSHQRYEQNKSLQVFACWNGAVVFSAKPLIEKGIRFRRSKQDECYAGEPRLFCKDLWMEGYGKIAVVPTVNLEYTDKNAEKVKQIHGYVTETVKKEVVGDSSLKIDWILKPPDQVKCMANFEDMSWVAWNQSF